MEGFCLYKGSSLYFIFLQIRGSFDLFMHLYIRTKVRSILFLVLGIDKMTETSTASAHRFGDDSESDGGAVVHGAVSAALPSTQPQPVNQAAGPLTKPSPLKQKHLNKVITSNTIVSIDFLFERVCLRLSLNVHIFTFHRVLKPH